ncbi:MAG: DNA polymerase III subunit gamma/tau, partial [Pseudomonadota bacterium]|nr:DNA polymerase III subunit gamma/tau [Pseudomonadota bacterium]
EVTSAPQPAAAAEMLVIRLAHLANMPTPGDIVRRLAESEPATETTQTQAAPPESTPPPAMAPQPEMMAPASPDDTAPPATMQAAGGDRTAPLPVPTPTAAANQATETATTPESLSAAQPQSLLDISALAEWHDDPLLAAHVRNHVRLVRLQPGLLDICLTDGAPDSLPGDMARRLSDWTGARWMVSLSEGPGGMTITEERRAAQQREIEAVAQTPLVRAITEMFPGAEIESVIPADATPTDQPNEDFST